MALGLVTCLAGGALKSQSSKKNLVILYKESHALVIWIGNYKDKAWSKLTNVEQEAKDVKAALERQGFDVKMVANPTAQSSQDAFCKKFLGYATANQLGYIRWQTSRGDRLQLLDRCRNLSVQALALIGWQHSSGHPLKQRLPQHCF